MWSLIALGAALLTSFNPILYKRILKHASPVSAVWGVTLLALPLLGISSLALSSAIPQLDAIFWLALLGSALLNAFAHLASTQAIKIEEVSLVTPLLSFAPVFTLLIGALFLGEIPSMRGLLGVLLVLSGAYWLGRKPGSRWFAPISGLEFRPGMAFALLAGSLWSITPLLEKIAIQHTAPQSPRIVAAASNALLVLLLSPVVMYGGKQSIAGLVLHKRELLLAVLIAGTAPLLGYSALQLGYVGYVTTLFKFSTVLTVVWGALLLGETGFSRRLPAATIMVLGGILIAVQTID